jgi:hypothetical protein
VFFRATAATGTATLLPRARRSGSPLPGPSGRRARWACSTFALRFTAFRSKSRAWISTRAANRDLADEAAKGRSLHALQDAAAKTAMVVAFGFAERSGDHCYDSVGVIDATGEWLGVRRENPLYPWEYECGKQRDVGRLRELRRAEFERHKRELRTVVRARRASLAQ